MKKLGTQREPEYNIIRQNGYREFSYVILNDEKKKPLADS